MLPMTFAIAAVGAEPSAKERLDALFAESWEFGLAEDPLFATHAGDARYNDRLPRETLADQQRRLAAERKFLERLRGDSARPARRAPTRCTTTSLPGRNAMRSPRASFTAT